MSEPDPTQGEAIIYGSAAAAGNVATIEGLAQESTLSITDPATAEPTKVDGKTVIQTYKDHGVQIDGDWTLTLGTANNFYKGMLLTCVLPGRDPLLVTVESFTAKIDVATDVVVMTLSLLHLYSMADALAAGPINPATGLPYAGRKVSGVVLAADGSAVAGAVVTIEGTELTATTAADGSYAIHAVATTAVTVACAKAGSTFEDVALGISTADANVNFIATA
mgnify:CR=1 FL=1